MSFKHDHAATPGETAGGCLVLIILMLVVGGVLWAVLSQPAWIIVGAIAVFGLGWAIGRYGR